MTAPLREPPALHDRALQDLSFIRRTMEGAASFTDVPGWGLVATGASALAAAAIAAAQPTAGGWLAVWMLEALLGVTLGGSSMWRKMRRRVPAGAGPVLTAPARKFLFGFWPAILAGAVLTFALTDFTALLAPAGEVPAVLPGLWLLLYGLGVLTAGAFSVRTVPAMGAAFMVLGSLALLVPGIPGDVTLAIGFGGLQVVFGAIIARRHGG
ncbi:MAG: hypothetical protein OEW77_07245 [Gemmatimonadota bacterium]|nr:hypothetical protein [Gemmatimonadota bacterium]